jgi:CopG family nickel-responsive transcriptional regulator
VFFLEKVKRISLSIPEDIFLSFEDLVNKKAYVSRSKAITDAITDYIRNYSFAQKNKNCFGVIIIVYNHKTRSLGDKILDIEHSFHDYILSTNHFHIDEYDCLEVILAKANDKIINELASRLQSLKGVKQIRLNNIYC